METSRVYVGKCWVGLGWAPEVSGPGKGGHYGYCPVVSPTELAVRKFSRITSVFHVDNNFQQSLAVKKPEEEQEEAAAKPPANVRLNS